MRKSGFHKLKKGGNAPTGPCECAGSIGGFPWVAGEGAKAAARAAERLGRSGPASARKNIPTPSGKMVFCPVLRYVRFPPEPGPAWPRSCLPADLRPLAAVSHCPRPDTRQPGFARALVRCRRLERV